MRVQIVIKREGERRWTFLAHGAAYERVDALQRRQTLNSKGVRVMLLPLDDGD